MRVRAGSPQRQDAWADLGTADGAIADGLVFAPAPDIADWDRANAELGELFELSQQASIEGAPVVYVLDANAVRGRGAVLDCAVAAGLVGGMRALAFEGLRKDRYATAIGVGAGVTDAEIVSAVKAAIGGRFGRGQVIMLGTDHVGALLP